MSQKWEYNGVTLEVDLQDADFAESYEKAFARMEESEKEMQKVGMNSEMIRGKAVFREEKCENVRRSIQKFSHRCQKRCRRCP